jgi:hypothetical protein
MKGPEMKRLACFSLFAACVAVVLSQPTHAGKPSGGGGGGSSNSLGPVTITPDLTSFQNRYADLGGVLDHETGLIWGYDCYSMGVDATLDGSGGLLTVEADAVYLGVIQWLVNFYGYKYIGNNPKNPPNINYDPVIAAEVQTALEVAQQFTWRLPTVAEARDAVARGLFTYGDGECNVYFGSPAYPEPDVAPANGWRWSSNLAGKARGGVDSAWYWDLEDGSAAVIPNSAIGAIFVRTATPEELGP